MRNFVLIGVFVLILNPLFSQTIKGKVTHHGNVVPFASIKVAEIDLFTLTDSIGNYEFSAVKAGNMF